MEDVHEERLLREWFLTTVPLTKRYKRDASDRTGSLDRNWYEWITCLRQTHGHLQSI